jgi:alkanesulfonate monooxygenase SsuD/methylene tetrahydromethanopterin reductase-like flavin-dependent oxidoreductase (luciferase family)
MDTRPRVGVLLAGWASAERGDGEVLAQVCRAAVRADRLGFGVAWFTEQHAPMFGAISGRVAAPQLVVARLAAETGRIGLGTAVRLITGTEPVRIAEELVTLDHLTAGRVRYGIGAGSAGVAPVQRERCRTAFRAGAAELVEVLRGGAAGHGVGLRIPDLTSRVLVASSDPHTIGWAAGAGLGYFVGMFAGLRHPELVARFRAIGGTGEVRASRLVHVGVDDIAARRTVARAVEHFWPRFTPPSPGWRERLARSPGSPRFDDVLGELGWVVGGPDTVHRELVDYARRSDLDALDVCFHVPGLADGVAECSMDRFASEVLPRLDAALSRPRTLPVGRADRVAAAVG